MQPKVSVFDIDMALYEHEYIEQEGTLNKLVRAECVPYPWALLRNKVFTKFCIIVFFSLFFLFFFLCHILFSQKGLS